MVNVSENVETGTTPSEDNASPAINLARLVSTTHFNVPHVPMNSSALTEDVSHHAAAVNIWILFQRPAEHAPQPVPLVAQKETALLVPIPKSSQLEGNVSHASTHATLANRTSQPANHAKADSTFPTKTVLEPAHQELDRSTESALAAQESSWTVPVLILAQLDSQKLEAHVQDANPHALNAQAQLLSVLIVWIHSPLDRTLENVNKAQSATTVKSKTTENVSEFAILDYSTKMELASSEVAQADSKTMDLVDVSATLSQLEDVIHQLSD